MLKKREKKLLVPASISYEVMADSILTVVTGAILERHLNKVTMNKATLITMVSFMINLNSSINSNECTLGNILKSSNTKTTVSSVENLN